MKTAVTQIKERLINIGFKNVDKFIDQYLETEKQQIIDAYETKIKTHINEDGNLDIKSGELFYKETFETNKETLK